LRLSKNPLANAVRTAKNGRIKRYDAEFPIV